MLIVLCFFSYALVPVGSENNIEPRSAPDASKEMVQLATGYGYSMGDMFGDCALSMGDLDGDGFMDFAVGSPLANPADSPDMGQVSIFLGSDQDLSVVTPTGSAYWSATWDNTYEIVHFNSTPSSGEYHVWLYDVRCSEPAGYIYYAWAWADDTEAVWLPLVLREG